MKYTLSSGHEVYLMRLYMRLTYRGLMSGTLQWASEHTRQKLAEEVTERMSPGEPLFVVDDGRPELPGVIWMAEFESEDCVQDDEYDEEDEDFLGSRLFVCWFSDGMSDNPNADIQAILETADWSKNARTFLNLP